MHVFPPFLTEIPSIIEIERLKNQTLYLFCIWHNFSTFCANFCERSTICKLFALSSTNVAQFLNILC